MEKIINEAKPENNNNKNNQNNSYKELTKSSNDKKKLTEIKIGKRIWLQDQND